MPSIAPLEASVSPRMIVAAPRLTRLCEFEDKQLEAHYKRDTVRDVLESRTTHIAVAMALASLGSAAMNWAAGAEDFVLPAFALACAGCCWLACAGYVHLAASQCMCCVAASLLVSATLPAGHSVIPMQQLFIAAFAAAYAQLDVRHCAYISCAGTFGMAFITVLEFPLLSRFERAERLYVLAALALLECMMIFVSVRINTTMRTAFHFYREVEASASSTKPLAGTVKAATAEDERIVEAATIEREHTQTLLASTVEAATAERERVVEATTVERERTVEAATADRERIVEAATAERERIVEAATAERERIHKVLASSVEADTAERERIVEAATAVELKLRTAEAAKAARGSLIRMVMHDLRSPLLSVANAVAIVLDLMPETHVDDSVVVECLRAMSTCSQLMQHIVSDMLDFERIDSGRLVLVPAAMRVLQLLEAAADTFGGLAAAKGVTLRLIPLLPDLNRAIFIGDVRRLQQCVNNGVSNSIKVCCRARLCSWIADVYSPLPSALLLL
mmetsp:Transcript_28730/g.65903  ORF Transcript_28730/g.65903 Transcript_28730/m.65903 type:complete len:510 (-) Transcript_28730:378-1907(-)